MDGEVVEEQPGLSLAELARACGMPPEALMEYVRLGVIEPDAPGPDAPVRRWRFRAESVMRLHRAARLRRDLEIDAGAVALVLDLLEEMERMRARMRCLERLGD